MDQKTSSKRDPEATREALLDAAERLRAVGIEPRLRGNRIYFPDADGIEVQLAQG